ncbi:hypothetical protein E2C01_033900 [Portunus trituberculatus]|uniref:Uncharacterized protein n=1 Tax=Portunus trituberculatus TaxID=210409 RepID=A0A5B7F713_PORTR|nr:hypothetical protein [Portunus trituberculatus]
MLELANLECGRHSFLSFYLARDVSTSIFFSVDSSGTPEEEQHSFSIVTGGRHLGGELFVDIHSPPRSHALTYLVTTFSKLNP